MSETNNRGVGRPRSEESHRAILRATLQLVAEAGVEGTSIEAIAARAGVGKTTIYRRWPSKEAVIVEAINELRPRIHIEDTGCLRDDLAGAIRRIIAELREDGAPPLGSLLLRVFGAAESHPEFLQALYDGALRPRLATVERYVRQARARGELPADLDPLFLASLIAGPLLFHLAAAQIAPLDGRLDDLPERLVDAVLCGVRGERKT